MLSFAPVSDAVIALEREQRLPATSTVIGTLTNEFAPDYLVTIADRNTPWAVLAIMARQRLVQLSESITPATCCTASVRTKRDVDQTEAQNVAGVKTSPLISSE